MTSAPIPTESQEQISLFEWAKLSLRKYPELQWLHHIPNGGYRNPREARRFKQEGVKAGVPDLFLPVPRGDYCGLYVEMKRRKGGKVTEDQAEWHEALRDFGYKVEIARGWDVAKGLIEAYLS